jgi:hypothetical protein
MTYIFYPVYVFIKTYAVNKDFLKLITIIGMIIPIISTASE